MISIGEVEMNEFDVSTKKNTANVIPLSGLLKDAGAPFRQAVIEALVTEGFEMDETLPNLQLAREILDAIDWLESRGHGCHWSRFEDALLAAAKEGILVDLGAFGLEIRSLATPG
jgi:hypothetical protein